MAYIWAYLFQKGINNSVVKKKDSSRHTTDLTPLLIAELCGILLLHCFIAVVIEHEESFL